MQHAVILPNREMIEGTKTLVCFDRRAALEDCFASPDINAHFMRRLIPIRRRCGDIYSGAERKEEEMMEESGSGGQR